MATTLAAIVGFTFFSTDTGSIVSSIIAGALFLATLLSAVVAATTAARSTEVLGQHSRSEKLNDIGVKNHLRRDARPFSGYRE